MTPDRVSFSSSLASIRADLGHEIMVEGEGRFYRAEPITKSVSGCVDGPIDGLPRITWCPVRDPLFETRVAGAELNDYFGSSLLHQWRPDQEHWSETGGVVTFVDDRITKRVASRLTGVSGPAPAYASPIFGNRNALDFGATERHAKRLYTTDTSCSATNPFIQLCVWSLRSTPTQGVWLLGNGDATSYGYHGINGANGYVSYPNSMINAPLDLTSRLAHASILGVFDDNNVKSRGLIVRSDGKVWRTSDYAQMAAVTGQASGVPCIGNTGTSGSYGAPCMIADYAVMQGRILTQLDVAAFLEYLRTQYGFTMPKREVLWDGNSLHAACATAFYGATLPNTSARFFSAVASRYLPAVIGALRESANTRSCLRQETEKIYVGNEIVNSVIGGLSSSEIKGHLSTLFSALRSYGYRKIIYGTCMAASSIAGSETRDAINSWLVERLADKTIDELVNLHTSTPIDGQSCPPELTDPTNTTYFSDGLHLTTAGYEIYFQLWLDKMISAGC